MNIKDIVTIQYRDILDQAASQSQNFSVPPEGWLCTARKALKMSGAQLARRLGVSRAQVSKTEKNELLDSVTLRTLKQMSQVMGYRFVYAIVPDNKVEDIINARATQKATELVEQSSKQMALEDQALSSKQIKFEVDRIKQDLIVTMPFDFWNDDK